MTTTTAAPAVLTCSVCKLGTNTTRDGKCIECIARRSYEESMALRAENEGLAVEVKQYRLGNEKLRELARELIVMTPNPHGFAKVAKLQAALDRARALGVEVGR